MNMTPKKNPSLHRGLLTLIALIFFAPALLMSNTQSIISEKMLGGSDRLMGYISTDKPVYRESESVYTRIALLKATDNTPVPGSSAVVRFRIKDLQGNTLADSYNAVQNSSSGFRWQIPVGTAGGKYLVLADSPQLAIPEVVREFEIRAYRVPRLKSQIQFLRDGYGPGDAVQSTISVQRAEGGIPNHADITAVARVDGKEIFRQENVKLNAVGEASIEFALPDAIDAGDGLMSFVIEDGGVVETATKTLPILLQALAISFFPEGGELVTGLENRVYIQALRPDGKPADIGRFTFTPQPNVSYTLKLDQPAGISETFALPKAQGQGVVLSSLQPKYAFDEPIRVLVNSVGANPATTVTVHKRAQLLSSTKVVSEHLALDAADSEGVLIVTAWDVKGQPLAERLVYREPRFALNVDLSLSPGPYVPGGRVTVDILTTDENGKPVESVVGVTVTDDTVLEMIEHRDKAPRLPAMVYLEPEVKDLSDATIYLDPAREDAAVSVDLLLGTQGWRRFILVDYDEIKRREKKHAALALAERAPTPVARLVKRDFAAQVPAAAEMPLVPNDIEQARPLRQDLQRNAAVAVKREKEFAAMAEDEALFVAGVDRDQDGKIWRDDRYTVREFAFQRRANRAANERLDFTETLYWNAGVRTSARTGKASFRFDLSDSITSFRVMADGFARNGALGSADKLVSSVEPFYIEPKLPLHAVAGDTIIVPVTLVNATEQTIDNARMLVQAEGVEFSQVPAISLPAGARVRQTLELRTQRSGNYAVKITAVAGPFTDSVTRTLAVAAAGFPISKHFGGTLAPDKDAVAEVRIPDGVALSSIRTEAKLFPSPLASMQEALSALLREPHGCFEQTSSTNYPLVMAQQYFMTHQGVSTEKIERAKTLLKAGYDKLLGFESADRGYEWFGANPGHEALTAYGLMEFVDMAKVMDIDAAMIKRTRDWLLSRRDGKGGFKLNRKALDSFGSAPATTTHAYIVWAMLESGESAANLTKEISAIKNKAFKTDDSYVIALAANALYLAGDSQSAAILAQKLVNRVDAQGAVLGADTSITRSGGDALAVETTSLAILAWLREDPIWAANTETSIKWLFERSKGGRFGSTQSTVLALKAINAYDALRVVPKKPGSVQLVIDGELFGKPVEFDTDSKGALVLPDFAAAMQPGNHTISLRMHDGTEMPFALRINYSTSLPASAANQALMLKTTLSAQQITEGEAVDLHVSVAVGRFVMNN